MHSDETGIYEGSFTLDALEDGQRAVLVANGLNGAATVTVNGTEVGDLMITPRELDITDALQAGENTVSLKLVPLKYNEAHPEAEAEALVANGLTGGLTVEIR